MSEFKKKYHAIMEKYFPHKHLYKLTYCSGDFHEYFCTICDHRKFTIETQTDLVWNEEAQEHFWVEGTVTELTPEEAEEPRARAQASIRATMWLLDNVEPTASAGRDDGIDYSHEIQDGEIVKKK